jgi:uncharacterized protein (UPF0548 family)
VREPVQIVAVTQQTDRWGFAYGTLPHHVEQGEEAFVIERDAHGQVRFVVESASRHAHVLTRAGGPVASFAQRAITRRYLAAMARAVAQSGPR